MISAWRTVLWRVVAHALSTLPDATQGDGVCNGEATRVFASASIFPKSLVYGGGGWDRGRDGYENNCSTRR